MTYVTVAVSRLHNQYSYPPVRPSVRSSARPSALSPSVAGVELRLLFSLRMHRPYTGPIMYSVRDFVFDKYKSAPWSGGAARAALSDAFREIRKASGIARADETPICVRIVPTNVPLAQFHPISRYYLWNNSIPDLSAKLTCLLLHFVTILLSRYRAIEANRQKILQ